MIRLYKGHYIFAAGIILFSAVAGAWLMMDKPEKIQQAPPTEIRAELPKETEERAQEDVLMETLDVQGDIFTTEESVKENKAKLKGIAFSITEIERKIRQESGVNIFNNARWYDVFAIYENYKNRKLAVKQLEDLAKEEQDKATEIEKEINRAESRLKSLKSREDELKAEIADMKDLDKNLGKTHGDWFDIKAIQDNIFSRTAEANIAPREWKPAFTAPCAGEITSPFGYRVHPIWGDSRFHSGVDIGVDYNTPILASSPGVVILSEWYGGFGNAVILYHGEGTFTLYGHNESLLVSEGDIVRQGQPIALAGSTGNSTGPHCHFSMWQEGHLVNPLEYVYIPSE